jgi:hypothetical protein
MSKSSSGRTREQCQKILFNLGIKLGISPKLISERLLSDLDKVDMMGGVISIEALEYAIGAWRGCGMPNYAHGKDIPHETESKKGFHHPEVHHLVQVKPSCRYRKPFVCPDLQNDCHCRQEKTCH